MRHAPLIVTPGDPHGIGPEVVWKAIQKGIDRRLRSEIVCVGAREPFERMGARIEEVSLDSLLSPARKSRAATVRLLPAPIASPRKKGRKALHLEGFQSGWSIETAVRLIQQGRGRALVTGPISKERLQAGGYPYPGHTEFLAELCQSGPVTMMLANSQLRVSLVTTHLALRKVPAALSKEKIRRAVLQTAEQLQKAWGIPKPRIDVCALNPHAGESGLFGSEELRIIEPAIRELRRASRGRFEISGPLPADTLFALHIASPQKGRADAVICMYHDQGLIPVKLLDFQRTVNVTLGLPIVRTSVDHGVAFDIAGKNIADPSSFEAAVELAIEMTSRKRGIAK